MAAANIPESARAGVTPNAGTAGTATPAAAEAIPATATASEPAASTPLTSTPPASAQAGELQQLTIRESYWLLPGCGVVMLALGALGVVMLLAGAAGGASGGQGGQGDQIDLLINTTTALLLGILWTRVPLHQTTTLDRGTGLATSETRLLWTRRVTTTPLHEIIAVITTADRYRSYARLQLTGGGTRPLCSATRLLSFRRTLPTSVAARSTQVSRWLGVPLHHQE